MDARANRQIWILALGAILIEVPLGVGAVVLLAP